MQEPLLKTKLTPPRIPTFSLPRRRLLKQLAANLDKRLTLICADAGYGKTTLLAQLTAKIEVPYVWYQIDQTDQDLARFVSYLIEGMRRHIPSFGKMTMGVINNIRGQEVKTEILLGTFINELSEIPEARILFIFDDLQEIFGSRRIIGGFDYLLKHIPANVSIITAARSTPPISLVRLQNKNELLTIDHNDLKFTKEEIKTLCKQIGGYVPEPAELQRLETDSEGWITCLQFMIQPANHRMNFSGSVKSLLNQFYDYFDREIFSSLDEDLKFFLSVTSIFDYLLPEACDFVLSRKDSKRLIVELQKKHLFISSYDAPTPSYRYHNLFRSFLIDKLKETGNYEKSQNRAGQYWEKKNILSAALPHFDEARNFKALARLLGRSGEEYVIHGRSEFIKPFMERLPKTMINNNPTLIRLQGRIYAWDCNWAGAQACFLRARRTAQRQRDHSEIFASIHAQSQLKLDLGRYKGVANQIKEILRSKKLKNRRLRAAFLNHLAIALTLERKIKQSIIVYEKVLKILKRIKDDYRTHKIMHNIAVSHLEMGDFIRAQRYFETLIDKLRADPSPTLVLALNNLGHALTLQGRFTEVGEILKEAMKYSRLFNDRSKLASNYECLGVARIFTGEIEEAKQLLKQAENTALEINNNWLLSNIWDGFAVLAMNRGDLYEAKKYSDQALSLPIPSLYRTSSLLTKATVELSLRNIGAAKKTLHQIRPYLKESKHSLMSYYLQLGRYHLLKKDEPRARDYINRALALAEKNTYDFLLLGELRICPELIKFVRKTNLRSHYLQQIFVKLPLADELEVSFEPNLAEYDFVIRMFDKVQIFKNGKEIRTAAWRTRRFQELFCYFVTDQRGLARERIISVFWPDHSPATAKQLFYNALYRIRKVVGKNVITFTRGGYALATKYRYWIDSQEFERLIAQASRSVKDGNLIAGLIKYETAVALYRGRFMNDFYSEWCQQRQRYFDGRYLTTLRKTAEGYYRIGNFEKALKFCNLAISRDPYYEETHCLAMRCYAALDDLGGLKDCYLRLRRLLTKGLKTAPRAETTQLYEKLIKQRTDNS